MYSAIDIANYTVNYIKECGRHISNLKLQKLLYYIQAAFLCERGEDCFDEAILCWRHGPVIPSVYNRFSQYGSDEIPQQRTENRLVFKAGRLQMENVSIDTDRICTRDKELINSVLDGLMDYSAWYLVDRTHEEEPWRRLKDYNDEITSSSIRDYFMNHQERIYGQFN